jgi:hypothetical protein
MQIVISLMQDGGMQIQAPPLPLPLLIGALEIAKLTLMNGSQENHEEKRVELAQAVPNLIPFPHKIGS